MKRPAKKSPPKESQPVADPVMNLHQIQKMQVFGTLVGGVAHDFNNLLSIFHGYTEILQGEIASDNPLQEYLAEMTSAVERAKTLTAQLLNFSRAIHSEPKALCLGKLVLDFRKMLRRMLTEDIELVTLMEEEEGWVKADPRGMESLLTNLVVNACETMPKGGRLSLEVKSVKVKAGDREEKTGIKPGPYVRLVISDTGMGMEEAVIGRIFERGFTTKAPGRNIGLGLFLCAGIVEQSGGKIFVESAPGKGTTFEVFLPEIPPHPAEEPKMPAEKEVFSGNGEKILIVEDDGPLRKSLAAMIGSLGFQALCAANGDEALRILGKEREIRLVISDVVMPLLSGVELAEIVHKRWPGTKIILTSGYLIDSPTDIVAEYVFLPKPISRGALIHNIRKILNV